MNGSEVALVDRHSGAALGLVAAVRGGQLGLPHALHGELYDDAPVEELAARAVDVVTAALGPCQGDVQAVCAPDAWTLTCRWLDGVLVTLLVGRSRGLVHRYRVLGSNGQAYADLTGPAFQLVGATVTDVPFGPSAEERYGQVGGGGGSAEVARVLQAARRSAASGRAEASVS